MGIDIYLTWADQTEAERQAQYTGFSTTSGDLGYLREAYHGRPYATMVLLPEGWQDDGDDDESGSIPMRAAVLRERLPLVVFVALYRHFAVYEQGRDPAFLGDVNDGETLTRALTRVFAEIAAAPESRHDVRLTEEQHNAVQRKIEARDLPGYALAFVDFVELAERKERQTGEPCRVIVSA